MVPPRRSPGREAMPRDARRPRHHRAHSPGETDGRFVVYCIGEELQLRRSRHPHAAQKSALKRGRGVL
jgi:hypothetical protein